MPLSTTASMTTFWGDLRTAYTLPRRFCLAAPMVTILIAVRYCLSSCQSDLGGAGTGGGGMALVSVISSTWSSVGIFVVAPLSEGDEFFHSSRGPKKKKERGTYSMTATEKSGHGSADFL